MPPEADPAPAPEATAPAAVTPAPGAAAPSAPQQPASGEPAPKPNAETAKPERERGADGKFIHHADAPPGALTDAPKPGEGEPKPGAAAPAAVPEAYEFKPPEIDGKPAEVDPEGLTAFQAAAKEAGLTQAQFQALGEHGAKIVAEQVARAQSEPYRLWHDTQKAWQAEIKADPEIGGAKLAENVSFAARAIDALGGEDLRTALNITGAGNNPAIVRAMIKMGRMMADPTSLSTGKPANGARPRSAEQTARDMYNNGGGNYPDLPA